MECKYHLELKWVTKIITITSTFDDRGRVGSNTCSGFRVSFNQELYFRTILGQDSWPLKNTLSKRLDFPSFLRKFEPYEMQ